jgi:hypothetical protein
MFSLWMLTLGQFIACKGCQETKVAEVDTGLVEGFTNNWGKWLDMTKTPEGNPVIAYYDVTHGALGLATGTLNDGSVSWEHEEIDGYPNEQGLDQGDRGAYASVAIDDTGTTWVAYYDASLQTLRYGMRTTDATEWTLGVADTGGGGTPDAGLFSAMALDANGYPVIAHYDRGRGELRVAHWDGSSFSGEVIDAGEDSEDASGTIPADTGKFASIAIVDGFEYIAYYDVAGGNLMLASGLPGNYSTEIIDADGDIGQWTSIVVVEGTVHIAYQDISANAVMVASGTPGNWVRSTVDQGKMIGADTAILNAPTGLVVAYQDAYNNDIKIATQNGQSWNTQTLGGVDGAGALGFHNELVEIDGTVYAATYNFTTEKVWFSSIGQ